MNSRHHEDSFATRGFSIWPRVFVPSNLPESSQDFVEAFRDVGILEFMTARGAPEFQEGISLTTGTAETTRFPSLHNYENPIVVYTPVQNNTERTGSLRIWPFKKIDPNDFIEMSDPFQMKIGDVLVFDGSLQTDYTSNITGLIGDEALDKKEFFAIFN